MQLWIADVVKAAVGLLGRENLDGILMLSQYGGMGEIHCSVFSFYFIPGNTRGICVTSTSVSKLAVMRPL